MKFCQGFASHQTDKFNAGNEVFVLTEKAIYFFI